VTAFDAFGRRCLAWPAAMLGAGLTALGGECLRFAAWLMEYEDLIDENGDWIE
jgi:hypothetical protein